MDYSFQVIEDDLLTYINKARKAPLSFLPHIQDRIESFEDGLGFISSTGARFSTKEGKSCAEDLIIYLSHISTRINLERRPGLDRAATNLCSYLSSEDLPLSHSGTGGSALSQRVTEQGIWSGKLAECIAVQMRTGLELLINLLSGDGDPARTDRNTIMNPLYTSIGIKVMRHPRYNIIAVIVLGERFCEFDSTKKDMIMTPVLNRSIIHDMPSELKQL